MGWDDLPPDLQEVGKSIRNTIYHYVSFGDLDDLLNSLEKLARVQGHPSKLSAGEDILRRKVKPAIVKAGDSLSEGFDGFHRGEAWTGTAANAFFDYGDRLVKAVDAVSESPVKIADAIQDYRTALTTLWKYVLEKVGEVLTDIVDAFNGIEVNAGPTTTEDAKDKAKGAKARVSISTLTSFAKALIEAGTGALTVAADKNQGKADVLAKLADAETPPKGLNEVSGPSSPNEAAHYMGPSGLQLPMPTGVSLDPDWTSRDVKDGRWVPKGDVKLSLGPLMSCVRHVRGNGTHWNAALKHHEEAFMTLEPEAFSVLGHEFYERVGNVMGRDHNLYFHSDARLDALATLLARVGNAYGAADDENAVALDRAYLKTS